MPVTGITPTGPAGTCDICRKRFGHYEGNLQCDICGAVHCDACFLKLIHSGGVHVDAGWDGERTIDLTKWHRCERCNGVLRQEEEGEVA